MTGKPIEIHGVDHIGIRVKDAATAMRFYGVLGFEFAIKVPYDDVTIIRNKEGVEINLIHNSNDSNAGKNILMDVPVKYPGYTHVALRVASVADTVAALKEAGIVITQGPVKFGDDGNVSVFVRDPDRNVIELRGRDEDSAVLGAAAYKPEN
jgi:catechol 2,3-dioxygenase-like lactoylglutathione lyase family enzyme